MVCRGCRRHQLLHPCAVNCLCGCQAGRMPQESQQAQQAWLRGSCVVRIVSAECDHDPGSSRSSAQGLPSRSTSRQDSSRQDWGQQTLSHFTHESGQELGQALVCSLGTCRP